MDKKIYLADLDVFQMTENPEECSNCGSRTEFIELVGGQLHICRGCGYIYKLEEGEL